MVWRLACRAGAVVAGRAGACGHVRMVETGRPPRDGPMACVARQRGGNVIGSLSLRGRTVVAGRARAGGDAGVAEGRAGEGRRVVAAVASETGRRVVGRLVQIAAREAAA